MPSSFFGELQLSSFTFNLQFLYELKLKVRLSKSVHVIFRFRFHFIFIKVYIFVPQNAWTLWLWNVVTPFKTKIIGPHTLAIAHTIAMHTLAPQKLTW